MESTHGEPPIEEVGGKSQVNRDSYFDPREFNARASLEDQHYWHLARREVLLQTLRSVSRPNSERMLEIGCGAGTVATFLNEHGYEVDYADVHREALEVARSRATARLGESVQRRRFLRLDVCDDELPTGYGTILLLDVIEHLPDDAAALRHVHDALDRPGAPGLLVVTVPAFPSLWSPYDVVEHHKRRYTHKSARAVLEACGFEVERITCFFSPLFFAAGGVKLVRAAVNKVRAQPEPEMFTDLVETRSSPLLTRGMLAILWAERRALRTRDIPVGTSLLCIARARTSANA